MASLIRKLTSQFWIACFRDVNGSQRRKSTHETDRKKAQRIADTYEQLAQRKKAARAVRETMNGLVREVFGHEIQSATVKEFTAQWLAIKKPEVSTATCAAYKKTVTKLLELLGTSADEDISLVRRAHIVRLRDAIGADVSAKTANWDLGVIRSIFREAKDGGYLYEDPAAAVKPLAKEVLGVHTRPFTIFELRAILDAADPEWQSLIRFGLYTGQRLGDLAALKWSNLDSERGVIQLRTRKTHKVLVIPIAAPLAGHIAALSPGTGNEPLHPRAFRLSSSRLSKEFGALLAKVGVRHALKNVGKRMSGRRERNELSFHSLRHTAVSLLKDAGVPQAVVQELVGHGSVQMSQQYTHVGLEALAKAAAALPEI